MSIFGTRDSGPKVINNGLKLWFDAAQTVSFPKRANPTTGDTWVDRASGLTATINNGFVNSYFLWNSANGGYFEEFASNDNYVTINSPSFTNLTQITIQSVFMYTAGQFEGPKFLNISGSTGQVELGTGFGGSDVGVILYGGTRIVTSVTQNVWNFASATINIPTGAMTLRINGNARSTNTHGSTSNINFSSGWMLSRNPTSGTVIRGRLAAVLFYDRALTADEELQNFNTYRIRYGI
jgi:hypothetical protein